VAPVVRWSPGPFEGRSRPLVVPRFLSIAEGAPTSPLAQDAAEAPCSAAVPHAREVVPEVASEPPRHRRVPTRPSALPGFAKVPDPDQHPTVTFLASGCSMEI
jgi:hypothetical protein